MSFTAAKQHAQKMGLNTSEREATLAMVEAMESVADTVTDASSTIRRVGEEVSNSLRQSEQEARGISTNLHFLMLEIRTLNNNLRLFDAQATKLGKTANWLTIGLLIAAFISAAAAVVAAKADIVQKYYSAEKSGVQLPATSPQIQKPVSSDGL